MNEDGSSSRKTCKITPKKQVKLYLYFQSTAVWLDKYNIQKPEIRMETGESTLEICSLTVQT